MTIIISNLTKTYPIKSGRKIVYDNFSCTFEAKDRIGLIGKNGAGKSTLIRLLSGAELPDSGSINVRGSVSWPVGLAGGFASGMSAKQNCEFVLRAYGLTDNEITLTLKWIEEFSEIGSYFNESVSRFSSGMRSRVAFALSMSLDFDWYLIDEITAVGDMDFRQKCAEMLQERSKNSGLFFVSHNLREVLARCNKAILIKPEGAVYYDNVLNAIRDYQKL